MAAKPAAEAAPVPATGPPKPKAGVPLSKLYPTVQSADVSQLPEVFLDQCRYTRRCSVKVVEAKGLSKAFFAFYVEVHCDDKSVATSQLKEASNQAPFWGEDLDVKVANEHKTLTVKLFGVEPSKAKKGAAPKVSLQLLSSPGDSGYSPAKLIGEVVYFLEAMDKNASQEAWQTLTLDKGGKRKAVEGIELRFSVTYEEILVLPPLLYEGLVDLLIGDPTFELLVLLARADLSDVKLRGEIAEHIVHIGESKSITAALLSKLITDDIAHCSKRQVLFRGNTLVTKSTEYFQRFALNDWIAQFRPIIDEIMADEKNSCEVVQAKMAPGDKVDDNLNRLIRYLDMAFSVISSFRTLCSRAMRIIYKTMMVEAQRKFGSEEDGGKVGYTSVTGFLFLRLFVPVFVTPKTYGFTEGIPEGTPGRTLTLISTVLQKLANFLLFDTKDANLDKVNFWLLKKIPLLQELIDDVINDTEVTYWHIRPRDLGLATHMSCLLRLVNQHADIFDAVKETSDKAADFLDGAAEILPETLAAPAIIQKIKMKPLLPVVQDSVRRDSKSLADQEKALKSISSETSAQILAQRREQELLAKKEQKEKEQKEKLALSREKSQDRPSGRAISENFDKLPSEAARQKEFQREIATDAVSRVKSNSKSGVRVQSENLTSIPSSNRLGRSNSNSITDQLSQALDDLKGQPMAKAQIQEKAKEMLAAGASSAEIEAFIQEQAELRKKLPESSKRDSASESSSAPNSDRLPSRKSKSSGVKVLSKDEIKEKAKGMLASGVPNDDVIAFIKEQQDLRDKQKAPKKE